MIFRPDYIEALNPYIDKPLVNILAGVRRCGKSTIFEMVKEELPQRGIPAENITAGQMYEELSKAMESTVFWNSGSKGLLL